MNLQFIVNGNLIRLKVEPRKRLLDILREDLGLTGSKEGCGQGECGSCTVILNGRRVNSCLVPAFQLPGSWVLTIEGLQELPVFERLRETFVDHGAVQCGYCIPGYAISAVGLLSETDHPLSDAQIRNGLAGNLCRCTGYSKILQAVRDLQSDKEIIDEIKTVLDNVK